MNKMVLLLALSMSTASFNSFALEGGSGIGGTVLSASINWCDDASIVIADARDEAMETLGFSNDKVGAIKIMYQGFLDAAAMSDDSSVNTRNSITMRTIARGIKLAQILGVPEIIDGKPVPPGLEGEEKLRGIISVLDWYSSKIQSLANDVDKNYFIPYASKPQKEFDTKELERKLISHSISNLNELDENFIKIKNDRTSYYSTASTLLYMQSLAFMSQEVAADLKENILGAVYDCQSKKLDKLSGKVSAYIAERGNGESDVVKLNKFVLETRSIAAQIEAQNCVKK
ncbi:MAG: hypothetical protein AB7I27_05040 [Bacteriovoracaceae bacterium]